MLLNYKYEIYPNGEQIEKLNRWLAWCRQTYNSALLDKNNRYRQTKKSLGRQELQSIQVQDKKKYDFLKTVPSQPLQEVFFRLEKAFDKFFKKEAKYPKLKSEKDYCSLTFTQFGMGKQLDKKYNTPHRKTCSVSWTRRKATNCRFRTDSSELAPEAWW